MTITPTRAATGIGIDRLSDPHEAQAAFNVFLRSMVGLPLRPEHAQVLVEPGRVIAAVTPGTEPREVVGAVDSWSGGLLTVPGGNRVSHAAVSRVGVLPTHTRRGILSSLIRAQLEEFHAAGEVVATLRASEAVIYERFGYGVASNTTHASVDRRRASLRADLPCGGSVRLLDGADTGPLVRGLHEELRTPGHITRAPQWWAAQELARAGQQVWTAVHTIDGQDDGYVVYAGADPGRWFTSTERTLIVTDFVAHSMKAWTGLLDHLFGLDLVDRIEFATWPSDDPLPWALTDRRALAIDTVRDETWLRLVDVERALDTRSYNATRPVAITVQDAQLAHNNGTYLLGPDGATRTSGEGALRLDVAALGALYLGGATWWQLAQVGRVHADSQQALAAAEALFATSRLPFAGTSF